MAALTIMAAVKAELATGSHHDHTIHHIYVKVVFCEA